MDAPSHAIPPHVFPNPLPPTVRRRSQTSTSRMGMRSEGEGEETSSSMWDDDTRLRRPPKCGIGLAIAAALIPLTAAILAAFTVASCYLLTEKQDPFLHKGIVFPAISFLGRDGEAKFFYQVGFATTGLLLLVTIALVHVLLFEDLGRAGIIRMPTDRQPGLRVDYKASKKSADRAFSQGMLSAFGVILQGVCVLDIKITPITLLHWTGALLFVVGAQSHAQEVMNLYENTAARALKHFLARSLVWKQSCVHAPAVMFVIPILLQIGRAAFGMDMGAPVQNAMGIMQWGIISSFVLFFLSYSLDLYIVISRNEITTEPVESPMLQPQPRGVPKTDGQ